MFIAVVNWDKCTGCGDCVPSCPVDCFEMSDGKSLAFRASACIDCGTCVEVCPEDAIAISIGWGGLGAQRYRVKTSG
jgi:NAD-dependent dihydropyrimidine dehydrogenase PreA subunit